MSKACEAITISCVDSSPTDALDSVGDSSDEGGVGKICSTGLDVCLDFFASASKATSLSRFLLLYRRCALKRYVSGGYFNL